MGMQGFINQAPESFWIFRQHRRPLLKAETLRTIAAVVRHVAGSLVRQQIYLNKMFNKISQQINNIAMVSNSKRFLGCQLLLSQLHRLSAAFHYPADPALVKSGFNSGSINLCYDRYCSGNDRCLALRTAHTSQP